MKSLISLLLLLLTPPASLCAQVFPLADFEIGLDGFLPIPWNTNVQITPTATGATHGVQALKVAQTGGGSNWVCYKSFEDVDPTVDGDSQLDGIRKIAAIGQDAHALEFEVTGFDAEIPATELRLRLACVSEVEGYRETATVATLAGNTNQTVTVSIPFDKLPVAADAAWYQLWIGVDGDWGQEEAALYLDNIRVRRLPLTKVPKTELLPAKQGLHLHASLENEAFQRQNVRTTSGAFTWVGASEPVEYALTVGESPEGVDWQTHLFLVPAASNSELGHTPDWHSPHVLFAQIITQADGHCWGTLRYKSNAPESNSMFWNEFPAIGPVGLLGGVAGPKVGEWRLTAFGNSFTLRSPDGATVTAIMPPSDAALFAGPLYVYAGIQPNAAANIGKKAILKSLSVKSGSLTLLTPDIPAALASGELTISASDRRGLVSVANAGSFWFTWEADAPGMLPQWSSDLSTWHQLATLKILHGLERKFLLIEPGGGYPALNAYFRLKEAMP